MIQKIAADHLFKQLDRLEYGSITLTLPNGTIKSFEGKIAGPRASIILHDWQVISNLIFKGDVGFGEDYFEGRWDTDDLPTLLDFALRNKRAFDKFVLGNNLFRTLSRMKYLFRRNTTRGSKTNIHKHYDLGNDFYRLWLDPTMTYSSALFNNKNETLSQAQNNKYARITDHLPSQSGELLEIGCGWGGFAKHALKQGDFKIKGITLSNQQHSQASEQLKGSATIALEDYRHQTGKYDHIVSIEMFEAVGEQYWDTYFKKLKSLLKESGKAVIQTITINEQDFPRYRQGGDFIRSYIFPGGMLPSFSMFKQSAKQAGLEAHSEFYFGQDYAKTLRAWLNNFNNKQNELIQLGFDDKFIRLWRFYLASCIAGFNTQCTDVVQVELNHI